MKSADKNIFENVLAIDIGNSRCKWGFLKNLHKQKLINIGVINNISNPPKLFLEKVKLANKILISNVAGEKTERKILNIINQCLSDNNRPLVKINIIKSAKTLAGIINNYQNPEKLGVDRLLAMVGLINSKDFIDQISKSTSNNILISCGTAITIDYLQTTNNHKKITHNFCGGLIIPGIPTLAKALNQNTANLPKVNLIKQFSRQQNFANNTQDAIIGGIINCACGAIEKTFYYYQNQNIHNKINSIYFTGGDAKLIALNTNIPQINKIIIENLVIKGLLNL